MLEQDAARSKGITFLDNRTSEDLYHVEHFGASDCKWQARFLIPADTITHVVTIGGNTRLSEFHPDAWTSAELLAARANLW